MLSRLFPRRPTAQPPLPEPDAQLALGALLVRVALADGTYRVEEITQIDRIMASSFGLNPVAAAKLRATCEKLEKQAPGTEEFADLIREEVPYEDRLNMVNGLWEVVMADGIRRDVEEDTLHLIETTLGITTEDSDAAKAAALGKNQSGLR